MNYYCLKDSLESGIVSKDMSPLAGLGVHSQSRPSVFDYWCAGHVVSLTGAGLNDP